MLCGVCVCVSIWIAQTASSSAGVQRRRVGFWGLTCEGPALIAGGLSRFFFILSSSIAVGFCTSSGGGSPCGLSRLFFIASSCMGEGCCTFSGREGGSCGTLLRAGAAVKYFCGWCGSWICACGGCCAGIGICTGGVSVLVAAAAEVTVCGGGLSFLRFLKGLLLLSSSAGGGCDEPSSEYGNECNVHFCFTL